MITIQHWSKIAKTVFQDSNKRLRDLKYFIVFGILVSTRDIQRLSTTPFSLVLRKEYFDWPQRDSRSTLHLKEGRRGESVLLYSVMSRIDASVRIVTKSTKVGPSAYILHLSGYILTSPPCAQDHRVQIFTRDETASVYLPTQPERTLQLYWWW